MGRRSVCAAGLLLVGLWSAPAISSPDTTRLAKHLQSVRGYMWLPAKDYRRLQTESVAWIDARVKAGESLEDMNRELGSAGLLPNWPDSVYEMDKSHAGYVEAIKRREVRGANDVFVIETGMYAGTGCSLDVTALVYERNSLTRLAEINAEPADSGYALYLSGVDVGSKDETGARLIASGWVVSNCTSTWNGKRIRIDRLNGSSVKNLLALDLYAHDRDAESVAARIEQDVITFEYDGGINNPEYSCAPAIARYRIVDGRAVREAPIALTRAGFIQEWLSMTDADPGRWGEPQALESRTEVAAEVEKHGFEWVAIALCGGSPPGLGGRSAY